MQTKIYLLLFLLGPLIAQTQSPIPFPNQDATWLYGRYDDFGNQYASHLFYLDGDSSYQGETWSILYNDYSPGGLIRQDSSLKVWIVPVGMTTPELLYDFGVALGDTVRGIRTQVQNTIDTVVVTYISTYNNTRTWTLSSIRVNQPWIPEYRWTEGVGDESWLSASSPINMVSGTTYLNCFSNLFFSNPANPCIVSIEKELSQSLKIYPNPGNGKFRLDFERPARFRGMQVMDVHGRLLRPYAAFEETLNLTGLGTGIYFLRLQTIDGKALTRKLIVE